MKLITYFSSFLFLLLVFKQNTHKEVTIPQLYKNLDKLPFREIDYSVNWEGKAKLITSYTEALQIGLAEKTLKSKKFYTENAVYLFQVGGGCFGSSPDEISVKLENNIIKIDWEKPNEPCPEVGEATAFYGEIIINKKEHPNYKNLTVKYYWEK